MGYGVLLVVIVGRELRAGGRWREVAGFVYEVWDRGIAVWEWGFYSVYGWELG